MALKITSTIDSDSGRTSEAYMRILGLGYDANSEVVELRMSLYLNQASSVNKTDTIISKAVKVDYIQGNVSIAQFEANFTIPKIYTFVKNKLIATGLTVIDV